MVIRPYGDPNAPWWKPAYPLLEFTRGPLKPMWIWSSDTYDPVTTYVNDGGYYKPSMLMQNYNNDTGAAFVAILAAEVDNELRLLFNGEELVQRKMGWEIAFETHVLVRPGVN